MLGVGAASLGTPLRYLCGVCTPLLSGFQHTARAGSRSSILIAYAIILADRKSAMGFACPCTSCTRFRLAFASEPDFGISHKRTAQGGLTPMFWGFRFSCGWRWGWGRRRRSRGSIGYNFCQVDGDFFLNRILSQMLTCTLVVWTGNLI